MPCKNVQPFFAHARAFAVSVSALALIAQEVQADGRRYTAHNDAWKAECGACHLAYPPQMLPASSWRALMSGLDKHFGTDASLDSRLAAEIAAFLERNAPAQATKPSGKPVLRITETRWFRREHEKVPASKWKDPQVKSAANCVACHGGAEDGDYSEHNLKVPK